MGTPVPTNTQAQSSFLIVSKTIQIFIFKALVDTL